MTNGFQLFSVSTLLTFIASFLLSIFVFYRNNKSKQNILWGFVSLATSIWGLGLYKIINSDSEEVAIFWNRILYLGGIFVPVLYYHFVSVFLKREKVNKKIISLFYIISLIFLYFNFTSSEFIKGAPSFGMFKHWLSVGYIYYIFIAFFALVVFLSFVEIIKNIKSLTGFRRSQMRYILFAGVVGFAGGATNFLPQVINFYPVGNYFVFFYVVIVAYAILRYRLMGIRVLLSNVFIYTILIILTEVSFYLTLFINLKIFDDIWSFPALSFGILISIIFIFLFIRIFKYSESLSDIIFYKGKNPQHIISKLVFEFNQIVDINELSKLLNKRLEQIIDVEKVAAAFCLPSSKEKPKVYNKENFVYLESEQVILLNNYLAKKKEIIIREELERDPKNEKAQDKKILALFKQNKISAAIPLEYHNQIVGFILLGDKKDAGFFTKEEISFLDIFSKQIASSFMDAYLYSNMKKEVARQTKELKDKTAHLEKLLKMRSEFLDIVSHQLRTPVSVIKGMLSMVLEGSVPPKKRKEFLEGSFKKSIKLGQIINDILRASEMDTEQEFELKLKKTDITPMLQDIYEDKKMEVEDKGLELKIDLPKKKLPMIMTEESYLRQVVENLINNSVQYTKTGYIKMKAREEDGFLIIRVNDTGIGIPEKDREKLFKKFARADNAVNTYTDGSGLGLFIAKKVMEAHRDSEIYIEKTDLNKGTTFAIKIPIA